MNYHRLWKTPQPNPGTANPERATAKQEEVIDILREIRFMLASADQQKVPGIIDVQKMIMKRLK